MIRYFLVGALLIACAPESPTSLGTPKRQTSPREKENTKDADKGPIYTAPGSVPASTPDRTPSPPPTPSTPAPTAPSPRHWAAKLSTTKTVDFGGGEHCSFRVTLRDVVVDLTTLAGEITEADVSATAIEEVLSNPCPNEPIPPHQQTFTLSSSRRVDGGTTHAELAPGAQNKPPATLTIDGKLDAGAPVVSLSWHRNDFPPPLDWRIDAVVELVAGE